MLIKYGKKIMPKVRYSSLDQKDRYKIIGEFFEIISSLKSKKEVIDFFVGLLTSSESIMMARRIQVAKLLIEGNSYEFIRKKLKVSNHTINSTDKWLHGKGEDYEKWITHCLDRVKDKEKKKWQTKNHESLLSKYHHHNFINKLFS